MKVRIISISKEDYTSSAKGGKFHKYLLGKQGFTGNDFKVNHYIKGNFHCGTIKGIFIPEKPHLDPDWYFLAVRVKIIEP